jgi:unsaturated rhamnogalacturonyl hydrolase
MFPFIRSIVATLLLFISCSVLKSQPIPALSFQSLNQFLALPATVGTTPDFVQDLSGVEWHRLAKIWNYTGDPQYFRRLQKIIDPFVTSNGTLLGCHPSDKFVNGEALLIVYQVTQQEKYFTAANQLFRMMQATYFAAKEKKGDYSEQLPIAQIPFYAAYAGFMRDTASFTVIANQVENAFLVLKQSGKIDVFNTVNLLSILVDVLEYFPTAPAANRIKTLMNQLANQANTIGWEKQFSHAAPENQANLQKAQFAYVYAISKAIRKQYIPAKYASRFSELDPTLFTAEAKAVDWQAAACIEWDLLQKNSVGKNRLFLLDDYFNAEKKADVSGIIKPYHYKWDEWHNGGFYMLGDIIESAGLQTGTLSAAPTTDNLRDASIYMIVDPDHVPDNPTPNYMTVDYVQTIVNWVKAGGVLVLFHNDKVNTEFTQFNLLSKFFGITLNEDIQNRVPGVEFAYGKVDIPASHPVLPNVQKIYQKDVCSITVQEPAKVVLQKDSVAIFAVAKLGRGTVFVTGDPWLYNEYVSGLRLSPDFQNFQAAKDLVQWLIQQIPEKRSKK